MLKTIYCALIFSLEFYKRIGYWGLINIVYSLEGVLGKKLHYDDVQGFGHFVGEVKFDKNIEMPRRITVGELESDLNDFICGLFREVRWSCGHEGIETDSLHYGFIRVLLERAKIGIHGKDKCLVCNKQEKSIVEPMCVHCDLRKREKEKGT